MALLVVRLVFFLSLVLGSRWWAGIATTEDHNVEIMENGETLKAGLFAVVGAWLAATAVSDLVYYYVSWQQAKDLGSAFSEGPGVFGSAANLGIGVWLLLFNADVVAFLKAVRSAERPAD